MMSMNIQHIKQELEMNASKDGVLAAQRFHKEAVNTHGIKMPIVRQLAKQWFKEIKGWQKSEVFKLCDDLLESGNLEEAMIAFEWVYMMRKQYAEFDFKRFEHWIGSHIHNWSTCDSFCNNSMGAFLVRFPAYINKLKEWAVSHNRWLRRAAAVSLIVPARQGLFLQEGFAIANLLLDSPDDLVQKGYGWLLKVYSKNSSKEVYEYLWQNKGRMPRTALRYAMEHFPKDTKLELMKK
jgi:3-methyladenine DNA glycosylase AlkD